MPNGIANTIESDPIVDVDGKPVREFYDLIESLVGSVTISGTGSPNGVVEGRVDQLYRDTSGALPKVYINTNGSTAWAGV